MFEMTADLPLEHAPIGARRDPDECPAFVLKRVLSVDVHIPLPPVGTVEIAFVLYRQPCSRIAEIRPNRCAQLLAEDLGGGCRGRAERPTSSTASDRSPWGNAR